MFNGVIDGLYVDGLIVELSLDEYINNNIVMNISDEVIVNDNIIMNISDE